MNKRPFVVSSLPTPFPAQYDVSSLTAVASDTGDDDPGNTSPPHLSVDGHVESGHLPLQRMTVGCVVETVQHSHGGPGGYHPQEQVQKLRETCMRELVTWTERSVNDDDKYQSEYTIW